MNIAQALASAAALGLTRLDAQLLLLHAMGRGGSERAWLLAHDGDALTEPQCAGWPALCERRAAGVPLAYITGTREFFGLELAVTPDVLVPRPETEILVEWALECMAGLAAPQVLDLGTGSGAIALALKHQRPDARVCASDASAAALAVARGNGERLGLAVEWFQGHWLQGLPEHRWDLIVSNPPYIALQDPHLSALGAEPLQALVSGPDGLDDLRAIVHSAPDALREGGWLLLEHGWDQSAAVAAVLAARGFAGVQHRNDLAGIGRCTGAIWRTMK
jgi:release factor glutamine methyltransferase